MGGMTHPPLLDGSVTTAKLANSAVTAAKIADGTVGSAELATGAVTASKIGNGQVTSTALAIGSVDAAALLDGLVSTELINAGAGGVGSFALLGGAVNADFVAGTNYAGSGLKYAGVFAGTASQTPAPAGSVPAGTWRAHGTCTASASDYCVTLFERVA